ncbi:hypothetical protein HCN51_30200 [Nonomuraea sp. FMUSA5-5]|uniref:Uncharacterized protein n=1 Tax=Nonomuraea composti TaxID=2720023 RepID=A0ABX1BAT3_9ACTN|nr:hypothetical protein [Nonomuraea sp. FMUSA5-5]NJP93665.1 hypothetical protein [Nonomuraea sp. FMUSA5-5]
MSVAAARALRRSASFVNTVIMMDRLVGVISEPPTPIATRAGDQLARSGGEHAEAGPPG